MALAILVGALFVLSALDTPQDGYRVRGSFLGRHQEWVVDHPLAAAFIRGQPRAAVRGLDTLQPDTQTLAYLSHRYSPDLATLFFAESHYRQAANRQAQDQYEAFVNTLMQGDSTLDWSALRSYYVLFVPGLGYESDTSTGANWARQRRVLSAYQVPHELVQTQEWGRASANASLIGARVRALSEQGEKLMIVSASKGSLDVALALDKLEASGEGMGLKAWVSVGGILRGSPVADAYLKAPQCWWAGGMLWLKGLSFDLLRDMSYAQRSQAFDQLRIPRDIFIVHLVGAPLQASLSQEIRRRYEFMASLGPNDGLTPLADQLSEQGRVITELGLDHYFRDSLIEVKTLALALSVAQLNP